MTFKPVTKSPGYVLLTTHPLRYLRTQLGEKGVLHLEHLRSQYQHPLGADLVRVCRNERLPDETAANAWLVDLGLTALLPWLEIEDDFVGLKNGFNVEDLRNDRGDPIAPNVNEERLFKEPFNPHLTSGTFAENIRATVRDDLDELRESMRTFGWIDHHPAIKDEHGVVIVGHRRLTVAAELGIKPKVVEIHFGSDDAADAERIKLALASNLGHRPLSPVDRKKIAQRLYQGEWTMEKIAEMLKVSQRTISEDLKGLETPLNLKRPKGGRPKAPANPKPSKVDNVIEKMRDRIEQGLPTTEEIMIPLTGASAGTISKARRVLASELISEPLQALRKAWTRASEEDRAMFRSEVCG